MLTCLHCVEYIETLLFPNDSCITLLQNSLSWSNRSLFGLRLDLFTISMKALKTILTFLTFKSLAHAYLVKTDMTHNKYLTFLFLERNDPISAKYAAQISSLKSQRLFLWFF